MSYYEEERLFREKVRKSWTLMSELVSLISEDCYIIHSVPIEGGGYDCLALKLASQNFNSLLLNRRGVNALVGGEIFEHVWDRVDRHGAGHVAAQIAELLEVETGDNVAISAQRAREVAREVCDWIEQHGDENFYVGPLHWDGSPMQLLDIPKVTVTENEWPNPWQGPELALAINNVEVQRINQI